jgi:hypothetical protein
MAVPAERRRTSLAGGLPRIAPIAYRAIAEQIAGSFREAIAQKTIR